MLEIYSPKDIFSQVQRHVADDITEYLNSFLKDPEWVSMNMRGQLGMESFMFVYDRLDPTEETLRFLSQQYARAGWDDVQFGITTRWDEERDADDKRKRVPRRSTTILLHRRLK